MAVEPRVDFRAVESFLYREARLMDENAYAEWLALWDHDALYWIPAGAEDIDPARQVSTAYDNRQRLEARVRRLQSGNAHAQSPPSRLRRVVSNIEIEETAGGEIITNSNFVLGEVRRGKQDVFIGRSLHKLRRADGDFKIFFKKVTLVNNDEYIDNLTFLV
ncbi:MAG: aromatic-ring-hydroxylating dioxygenase subunit beta [Candidatus Binataceae bacterium]